MYIRRKKNHKVFSSFDGRVYLFNNILPIFQAFRLLSHKFHGKGSGKLKTEKRAKKLQEEKVKEHLTWDLKFNKEDLSCNVIGEFTTNISGYAAGELPFEWILKAQGSPEHILDSKPNPRLD